MKRIYSIAVGNLIPVVSDKAVKLIKSLDGFAAMTPMYPNGTLLYFDSSANAKRARNILAGKWIICGVNICAFDADDDLSMATFVGDEYGEEIRPDAKEKEI